METGLLLVEEGVEEDVLIGTEIIGKGRHIKLEVEISF